MVRLQRSPRVGEMEVLQAFNPTMVRLQHGVAGGGGGGRLHFQSHYGAIATHLLFQSRFPRVMLSIPLWCDCNTRRVQPKALFPIFQSHYGAIATVTEGIYQAGALGFQSHYGAIATTMA